MTHFIILFTVLCFIIAFSQLTMVVWWEYCRTVQILIGRHGMCLPLLANVEVTIFGSVALVEWEESWDVESDKVCWQCYRRIFSTCCPMNIYGWFPLGLNGLVSLLSKRLSRVFFSTTVSLSHQGSPLLCVGWPKICNLTWTKKFASFEF